MGNVSAYWRYLVYLCRCAVNGEPAAECIPEYIGLDKFFDFCSDHMLLGLAYDVLKDTKTAKDNANIMHDYENRHNYAVLIDVSQSCYMDIIRNAFAEKGINHTPLKGSILKDMYPVSYYRQCADLDILISPGDAHSARTVMEELGFETKSFGNPLDTDNYRIDQYVYVELHKELIHAKYPEFARCNDIMKRLVKKDAYEYAMTDEDFYIFMMVHLAKHLKWSAAGIRSILDIFVYLQHKPELDWSFIDEKLNECGLLAFQEKILSLVGFWFEGKEAGEDILMMADYIAESGWNGSEEHTKTFELERIDSVNSSKQAARIRYFFGKVFLGPIPMQKRYPILKKHKYLLPVCWIHRGFDVLINRRSKIDKVAHRFDNMDTDRSMEIVEMRKRFGL